MKAIRLSLIAAGCALLLVGCGLEGLTTPRQSSSAECQRRLADVKSINENCTKAKDNDADWANEHSPYSQCKKRLKAAKEYAGSCWSYHSVKDSE